MKVIKRKTNDIKIFAKTIEEKALAQVEELGRFEAYTDNKIRIMPDVHYGSGCTIGTTMTIKDKITPNLVGVDINCGMLTILLEEKEIDLNKLDKVISQHIPTGYNVNRVLQSNFDFSGLICKKYLNLERAKLSIGTLGGGNHFIEIDKDSKGNLYLVIHSGSRNVGFQTAKYYQDMAIKKLSIKNKIKSTIVKLKKEGRFTEIQKAISKIKPKPINKDLAYLQGKDFYAYLHDISIIAKYAHLNRKTMARIIMNRMGLKEVARFETVHNYIDLGRMILRKGAVSAEQNELILIPMNMRDGSILARGKGNYDWNYSAPHGAGRLMSRTMAKANLSLNKFNTQMKDIYSTSVLPSTLDEAPDAYKPMNEIIESIKDTVDIVDIIKPIYNYKDH